MISGFVLPSADDGSCATVRGSCWPRRVITIRQSVVGAVAAAVEPVALLVLPDITGIGDSADHRPCTFGHALRVVAGGDDQHCGVSTPTPKICNKPGAASLTSGAVGCRSRRSASRAWAASGITAARLMLHHDVTTEAGGAWRPR